MGIRPQSPKSDKPFFDLFLRLSNERLNRIFDTPCPTNDAVGLRLNEVMHLAVFDSQGMALDRDVECTLREPLQKAGEGSTPFDLCERHSGLASNLLCYHPERNPTICFSSNSSHNIQALFVALPSAYG